MVLLALQIKIAIPSSELSSDIDLDDILDGVWKMPNEGSSNLCVNQTEKRGKGVKSLKRQLVKLPDPIQLNLIQLWQQDRTVAQARQQDIMASG